MPLTYWLKNGSGQFGTCHHCNEQFELQRGQVGVAVVFCSRGGCRAARQKFDNARYAARMREKEQCQTPLS